MAFKMKGSPMQRNFPGAFKKETRFEGERNVATKKDEDVEYKLKQERGEDNTATAKRQGTKTTKNQYVPQTKRSGDSGINPQTNRPIDKVNYYEPQAAFNKTKKY